MMAIANTTWYFLKPGSSSYFVCVEFGDIAANGSGSCKFISHGGVTADCVVSGDSFIIKAGAMALWTGSVSGDSGSGFATNIPSNSSNPPNPLTYNLTSIEPDGSMVLEGSEDYVIANRMVSP